MKSDAKNLANNLSRAIDLIGTCQNCRVLSEDQICSICNDSSRDNTQVCVVENTSQVVQIEELGGFKGIILYWVDIFLQLKAGVQTK